MRYKSETGSSFFSFASECGMASLQEERRSQQQVTDELKRLYHGMRGLSTRSVRRYCNDHDVHATSQFDCDLDRVVSSSIAKVWNQIPMHIA